MTGKVPFHLLILYTCLGHGGLLIVGREWVLKVPKELLNCVYCKMKQREGVMGEANIEAFAF